MTETDGVAWSALHDAYGIATQIPALLARLDDASDARRDEAIEELWSRLCHQETVYSASAAAVPALAAAALRPTLSPSQRDQVLWLVVFVGRGEDTCWQGHSTRAEMEASERAVAAVAPDVVRWAAGEDLAAQAVALALGVHHPEAFRSAGTDPHALLAGEPSGARAAGAALARRIIAGDDVDDAAVRDAASTDAETLEVLDEVLEDEPLDRRARAVALELLSKTP